VSGAVSWADFTVRRVAIVDDEPEYAEGTGIVIEDAGFEPIILPGSFQTTSDLVAAVRPVADAVVCDHRLRPGGYAPFDGAEAVASFTDAQIPAILLTTYDKIDADVSIRLWRDRIPVLLSREDADPMGMRSAIELCVREVSGDLPSSRRPWQALVQVRAVDEESGRQVVDAIIPSWRPLEAVRFPAELLPEALRGSVQPGDVLIAEVNIGAERHEDLFLRGFRRAPEPVPEDLFGAPYGS
jgi:hypothetical protein